MDKLRSMGHYCPSSSLTLDPSKGGLALLQEASTQHSLPQLSYDPSFAERAAKNSTFGNSSYAHQRSSQPAPYSSFDTGRLRDVLETESMHRATGTIRGTIPGTVAGTIPRSASFSSQAYSEDEAKPEGAKPSTASDGVVTSQENSTGSRGDPQRKRKGSPTKGCTKLACSTVNSDSNKSVDATEQTSLKRQKSDTGIDAKPLKAERSASGNSGDSSPRSLKGGATSKPPHDQLPKQDYIHVRARRGQATDSHSLAERVRREKISERMKFLQDLVPGCSKVTGKAVMLDEIINYVQSLQRQIEFLSMKLAAVNPRLDYNYDQLLGKDDLLLQSRSPETTLLGPDPRGYGDLQHQHFHGQAMAPMHHHMPAACNNLDMRDMRGVESLCDAYLRRSMSVPTMASVLPDDHFSNPLSQAVSLCNGDLQSVVEMGFIQGKQGLGFGTQLSHGSSMCLPGKLKVEL